jgi:adenylosuccinate synthase
MDEEEFCIKLKANLELKNKMIKAVYNKDGFDFETVKKEYLGYADRLRKHVVDTSALLNEEIKAGKKVLFEGAQATMLDLDHGTYPYVTSSHPIAGGVCVGAGVGPNKVNTVVGVVKAYCTRVGEGPFPTEQLNEIGDMIRSCGREFGTVTGRPRRCGWLDACVVRYAGYLSGIDYMAITRLDILDTFKEIKMCVGYKYKGELINEMPASLKVYAEVEPVYETFEGWNTDITGARSYDELPANARKYVERMAEVTGIKLGIISVGPGREQTIILKEVF